MNLARDLMKRLLHLFPLAIVKESFVKKGTSESVIEQITGEKTQQIIKNFAFSNYSQTRQNIYLYELNQNFPHANLVNADFPMDVEDRTIANGELKIHCLSKTIFKVLIGRTGENVDLSFYQPVTVRIMNNTLIIHFTKLLRNVASYFPVDDFPIKKIQLNDEAAVLADILEYFDNFQPTPLDINAGVKYLWNIDDVDCLKVLSRKNASAVMETMDGILLFKAQYPADYLITIQRPLEKTVFQYLKNDKYLCKEFTTEPTLGRISVNQFPDDVNQVKNVVSKILANN